MFGLFKKPVAQVVKEVVTTTEKIDSKFIQKDIHLKLSEVLEQVGVNFSRQTEIETLKSKLETFKQENETLYTKIKSLENLGFVNTPSIIKQKTELVEREAKVKEEVESLENQISYFKIISEVTRDYSLKYPTYKFVPTKTMNDILKKYNLILSDTYFYGKEIPEDALEQANNFIEEINASKEVTIITRDGHRFYTRTKCNEKSVVNSSREYIKLYSNWEQIVMEISVSKLKIVAPMSHFNIPTVNTREYSWEGEEHIPIVKVNRDNHLEICVDKLNEAGLKEARRKMLEDPILMLEVPYGYIILKAWDEEADIIEIQNPNFN